MANTAAAIVVAQPRLNVRAGKSTDSEILGKLNYGAAIYVETPFDEWAKLAGKARDEYVSARYITLTDTLGKTYYVTPSALRVRSEPNLSATILALLPFGTAIRAQPSSTAGWLKLLDRTGYVASAFVSETAPVKPSIRVGVNTDPRNPVGSPSASEIFPLRYARFPFASETLDIPLRFSFYDPIINDCIANKVKPILVLNHQTWGEGRGYWWDSMRNDVGAWLDFSVRFSAEIAAVAVRYGDKVVYQIWNEGDQASAAAVGLPPLAYAKMLDMCVYAIRAVAPNAEIITQGHVSGDPNYWKIAQATSQTATTLSGVAIHPYGIGGGNFGRLGTVQGVVNQWRAITKLPIWFTEWGVCGGAAISLSDESVVSYATSFLAEASAARVHAAIWYGYGTGMDTCKGLVTNGKKGALWRAVAAFAE